MAAVALAMAVLGPLLALGIECIPDAGGATAARSGLTVLLGRPGLLTSIWHSVWVSALVTAITLPLAFVYAYALTRSCVRFKGLLRSIALIPILAPSLLVAISLIFWFGNQGVLRDWLARVGIAQIYGAPGIVIALVLATFPHALMVLESSLSLADGRLIEAADAMGTSAWRKLVTLTLPSARYGVASAAMLIFSYAISDFGVPKVIGGSFPVLATDLFKSVIGQQDFSAGSAVALLLLIPAALAALVEVSLRRRESSQLSLRSVVHRPVPRARFDAAMTVFCWGIALIFVGVLGMAFYASVVSLWPYDLRLSLRHYRTGLIEAGIASAYFNSLTLALWTALVGSVFVFGLAYWLEKTPGLPGWKFCARSVALLPMGIPGLVLGLGGLLLLSSAPGLLGGLKGTTAILVIYTVVHYYASPHLTAVTALRQIDSEFEAVAASLKVPFYRTLARVTLPICLPSLLEIGRYLFVNAMTTVSAVIFLYAPDTVLASIAIVNLDEAGETAPAAAMGSLIVLTSALFCAGHWLLATILLRRTQAWRSKGGV